jgi:O-antigen biosynthesis protein
VTPTVSILTPAYKPHYFAEMLRSAQAQTFGDWEHVICDDCPDGAIEALVREIAGDDPRVRYVRNPETIGGRRNYLQCFELARGRHIKYLNDDDLLAPECLARMSACLDAHPEVTLVTSYRRLIDEHGAALPDQPHNRSLVRVDSLLDGRGLIDLLLRFEVNVIGEPTTVMFRRADLADNRPHIMSFAGLAAPKVGDIYMWTSLLAKGQAIYLAQPLSSFRQHPAQVQRQPAFVDQAIVAWRVLLANVVAAGLFVPGRPRPLGARPLDPLLAIVRQRLDAILTHARALAAEGDLQAAELDLREILASDPAHTDARSDLACLLWQGQHHDRALGLWREVLADDPDHLDATVNLADTLLTLDRPEEARDLCRDFLSRLPWAEDVVRLLGQAQGNIRHQGIA